MRADSGRWIPAMSSYVVRSLLAWVALAWTCTAPARAGDLAPLVEMGVHLNVLSFDTALKERLTGDTLTLAIVHASDHSATVAAENLANAIVELTEKKNITVHRKMVRV